MPLRIQALQAGAEYRNRKATRQSAAMSRTIDAQCQTTGDDETALRQTAGKSLRTLQPRFGSPATADHGDLRAFQHGRIALHKQQRRGIGQLCQQRRVIRIVQAEQVMIRLFQPGQSLGSTVAGGGTTALFGRLGRQAQ